MSGQATGWVLRRGPHPDMLDRNGKKYNARARGMRLLLVGVADAANSVGEHAHPGVDNLCKAALYGRRQVTTLLGELIAEGWLDVEQQGGGKGKATVYRLPLMPVDTAQSLLTFDERYRAIHGDIPRSAEPDTAQSEPDTAQSRGAQQRSNNGEHNEALDVATAAQPPAVRDAKPTDDPIKRYAHELTVRAFEMNAKPVIRGDSSGAFPAVMAIFERLLRGGGVSVQALLDAIEGEFISVWTIAGVQTAVAQARPRRTKQQAAEAAHARSMGLDPDEASAAADELARRMFTGDRTLKSDAIDVQSRGA